MLRTFSALRAVEPGFADTRLSLQLFRVSVPQHLIPEPDGFQRLQNDIVDKLAGISGVSSVAFTSALPIEGLPTNWTRCSPESRVPRERSPSAPRFQSVSPAFFETMGTAVISGRSFTWINLYESRRVVIVSENLARRFWGTARPRSASGCKRCPQLRGESSASCRTFTTTASIGPRQPSCTGRRSARARTAPGCPPSAG